MCQAMDSLLRPVSKGPTATRRPPSVDACRGPGTLGPWDPGTLGPWDPGHGMATFPGHQLNLNSDKVPVKNGGFMEKS